MHGQQTTGVDIHGGLAEPVLDALVLVQTTAEGLALGNIGGRDLQRPLRHAEPAHAVRETCRAETDLRHLETVANTEQTVLVGDLEAVEAQFAMSAMLFGPHDRDTPHDLPARVVTVEEKGGEPLARVVRGACDEDEVLRDAGAGDEPLVTVDSPALAVTLGAGAHHPRRVGAAARMRFGHDKRRAHRAARDGRQPATFLLRVRGLLQQHHVAVVGRRRVEAHRAENRTRHLLVAGRHGDRAKTQAAILLGQLQAPEPLGAGLRAQFVDEFEPQVLTGIAIAGIGLQGQHVRGDEGGDPLPALLRFRSKVEVHASFPGVCASPCNARCRDYNKPPAGVAP